LKQLEFPTI